MKPLLLSLTSAILVMASCKKDRITPVATTTTTDATISQQNSTFAGRPPRPSIKGKWRLVLVGGGIMPLPPTPVTFVKKLHLHGDYTFTLLQGTSSLSGTYTLSTAPMLYPPYIKKLLTFSPVVPSLPPGAYFLGIPQQRYYDSPDTLMMEINNAADSPYEVYKRE